MAFNNFKKSLNKFFELQKLLTNNCRQTAHFKRFDGILLFSWVILQTYNPVKLP